MNSSKKGAYLRFRFKNRVCFKTCGLWQGKGGYCSAKRENIEYCIELEKQQSNSENYRNLDNILEWVEVFTEEKGYIGFKLSEEATKNALTMLANTNYDCYKIAEKLLEGVINVT